MPTKLIKCTCSNKYQAEQYGEFRVFNQTTVSDKKVWRCSVCGSEKASGLTPEEEKALSKKGKK